MDHKLGNFVCQNSLDKPNTRYLLFALLLKILLEYKIHHSANYPSRSLTSVGKVGDSSIKFLATEPPPMQSWTGSTVMDWEPGENGSDNLKLDFDGARFRSA